MKPMKTMPLTMAFAQSEAKVMGKTVIMIQSRTGNIGTIDWKYILPGERFIAVLPDGSYFTGFKR